MTRHPLDRRAVAQLAQAMGRSRIAEGLAWSGVLTDLERQLVALISDHVSSTVTITVDTADTPPDDRPMTYREAADRLGVSYSTLRRLVDRGELPVVVVGRRPRIHAHDLDAYLEGNRRG